MTGVTSDKILRASIALFSQKGFDSVTTKEIAKKAGVSEMTVFRHFENKRNLFEKAFDRYVVSSEFQSIFEDSLLWDLRKDLLRISISYQEALLRNQKIILMEFKNSDLTMVPNSNLLGFPGELRRLLEDYFAKMREKGIIRDEPKLLAFSFMAANFGFFMTYVVNGQWAQEVDINRCLTGFVDTLVRGLANTSMEGL